MPARSAGRSSLATARLSLRRSDPSVALELKTSIDFLREYDLLYTALLTAWSGALTPAGCRASERALMP